METVMKDTRKESLGYGHYCTGYAPHLTKNNKSTFSHFIEERLRANDSNLLCLLYISMFSQKGPEWVILPPSCIRTPNWAVFVPDHSRGHWVPLALPHIQLALNQAQNLNQQWAGKSRCFMWVYFGHSNLYRKWLVRIIFSWKAVRFILLPAQHKTIWWFFFQGWMNKGWFPILCFFMVWGSLSGSLGVKTGELGLFPIAQVNILNSQWMVPLTCLVSGWSKTHYVR